MKKSVVFNNQFTPKSAGQFAPELVVNLTGFSIEATNPIAQSPTELITSRLVDVLIGSLIGAIVGWFVYHEKLRHHVVKKIRITRLAIKKKK